MEIECITKNAINVQREFITALEGASEWFGRGCKILSKEVSYAATSTAKGITHAFNEAARVVRDPDGLRLVVVAVLSGSQIKYLITDRGLRGRAIHQLEAFTGVVSATRIFLSLNDLISGKFIQDMKDGKLFAVLTDIFFFAGRACVSVDWLAKFGVIHLGHVGKMVGAIPFFGIMAPASLKQFVELTFGLGLVSLGIEKVRLISKGENVLYNIVDSVSISSEIALTTLSLTAPGTPAIIIAGLAFVASTTGIAAFLLQPKNEILGL